MPKGQKKTKGTPELYNEVKKQVSLSLTPTAIAKLDVLAKERNLSRSEYVEQIARGSMVRSNNLSEDFVISPAKSIHIHKYNELPNSISSFLVTDLKSFAYVSSTTNLKEKFANEDFRQELNRVGANEDTQVVWIECRNSNAMYKTEQELLFQLRSTKFYQNIFKFKIQSQQTQLTQQAIEQAPVIRTRKLTFD